MSLAATRWAWEVEAEGKAKLVLLALADHADDDGLCWPSVKRLVTRCGLSERTVQRAILDLIEAKLVTKSGVNGTLPRFQLALNPRQIDTPTPVNLTPDPRQPDGGPPSNWHGTPVKLTPEPTSKPTIEPEKKEVAPPPAPPAAKPDPRGNRLPGEWQPSSADVAYAAERGLDPNTTAENFRDYWHAKAGQNGRKLDWPATWRTWCRREAEKRPQVRAGPAGPQPRRPATNGAVELLLRARERRAAEQSAQPVLEGVAYAIRR